MSRISPYHQEWSPATSGRFTPNRVLVKVNPIRTTLRPAQLDRLHRSLVSVSTSRSPHREPCEARPREETGRRKTRAPTRNQNELKIAHELSRVFIAPVAGATPQRRSGSYTMSLLSNYEKFKDVDLAVASARLSVLADSNRAVLRTARRTTKVDGSLASVKNVASY
jgi:hypothetical protein